MLAFQMFMNQRIEQFYRRAWVGLGTHTRQGMAIREDCLNGVFVLSLCFLTCVFVGGLGGREGME